LLPVLKNQKGVTIQDGVENDFDFLAWQHCFYFILALEIQHIKKSEHFIDRLCYNKI
jgi:hypothetical protein